MRKLFLGALIASVTATMPTWAVGGDREIAQAVMAQLQQYKAEGSLKGFDLDLKVEDGVVYLDGLVSSAGQQRLVEHVAAGVDGAREMVSNLKVRGQAETTRKSGGNKVVQASNTLPTYSDTQITDAVIGELQALKQSGALRGFDLDVTTTDRDVWVKGTVADASQKQLVLEKARRVRGVSKVVDDIQVQTGGVRQASTGVPTPLPLPQGSSMPRMNGTGEGPAAFGPARTASGEMMGSPVGSGPMPMQGAATYGAGAPRYDQPNMPSYAWPSYAAYPNYAAVSYPKQYSPSAWPYIGPFYPYPQVPLGWRRVSLEWDDGLWYLDFSSKR